MIDQHSKTNQHSRSVRMRKHKNHHTSPHALLHSCKKRLKFNEGLTKNENSVII